MSSPGKKSPRSGSGKKGQKTTAPMTAEGSSDRTVKSKKNQVRIFELFLKHVAEADSKLSAGWGVSSHQWLQSYV